MLLFVIFAKKMEVQNIVKWGFIGCGEVTEKKSGPAFGKIEGSEVVAVMSRDRDKAIILTPSHWSATLK